MQKIISKNSQKEKVAEELVQLNQVITEQDRSDYMKEKGVSRTLLSNYMNGKVSNLDRAIDMLLFFRNKISEKEKLINN